MVGIPFGTNCSAALDDGYSNTVVFIKTAVRKERPKDKKIRMCANNLDGCLFANMFFFATVAAGLVCER